MVMIDERRYEAEDIQVLEGLEAVRKKTRDVYRINCS